MEVHAAWGLAAAALPTITGNDYRVFVSLVTRADDAGRWSGTFGEIGQDLGLSWPTVARAFSAIQNAGFVRRIGETHRGSVWTLTGPAHDIAPLTHGAPAPERPRDMAHQRPSALDTSATTARCIKTPEPRVLNTPQRSNPPTTREDTAPNGSTPIGGGGESSVMHDISPVNRGYVKPSAARSDATPAAANPAGTGADDDSLDDKAAALLKAGVRDGRTRRQLAAHHRGEEIRKAIAMAAASKTAKDTAALTVAILRRGSAAAAVTADREKAYAAQTAQAKKTTTARAAQSEAAKIRAAVEDETAVIRAAPLALLREALAVAIVQGRADRRAKYAPSRVATDPAAALADALHAFHRPKVAAWIRSAVPGKIRAIPTDAEVLL